MPNLNRSKFSLAWGVIVLIILVVLIVSHTAIVMHRDYLTSELMKEAVGYGVDTLAMIEIEFQGGTSTGFNINPGTTPSNLQSMSSHTPISRVRIIPRNFKAPYLFRPGYPPIIGYGTGPDIKM